MTIFLLLLLRLSIHWNLLEVQKCYESLQGFNSIIHDSDDSHRREKKYNLIFLFAGFVWFVGSVALVKIFPTTLLFNSYSLPFIERFFCILAINVLFVGILAWGWGFLIAFWYVILKLTKW